MENESNEPKFKEVSKEELEKLVRHHVWGAIGIGLIPLPLVDMVALTALQVNLVRKIAKAYDIPFMKDKVKNIIGILIGSVVPSVIGPPLAASITKFVPVVGQTTGAITMPAVAGASTYATGKVFIQHFATGGTLLTFNPEKVKSYFAEMFKEGKQMVENITGKSKKNIPIKPVCKVGLNKVSFYSDGDKVVGNLFVPTTYQKGKKISAIISVPPATGVKEQVAGTYAERLSRKGFITLTFDHRTFGESEGEPRFYEDPFKKVEDIGNAVSFLRMLDEVDAEKIGLLGICSGAGYALYSAVFDRRIKALATVSGVFDFQNAMLTMMGKDIFKQTLVQANQAVQTYYETGEVIYRPAIPDITENTDSFWKEAYDYYRTSRGSTPTWENKLALMSDIKMAAFNTTPIVNLLAPTPFLVIKGSNATITGPASQMIFDAAENPKELFEVEGATHVDLYDVDKYVTQVVDKLTQFFSHYL